jgi:hypothetical protein
MVLLLKVDTIPNPECPVTFETTKFETTWFDATWFDATKFDNTHSTLEDILPI